MQAHHLDEQGLDHFRSRKAIYVPADDLTGPAPADVRAPRCDDRSLARHLRARHLSGRRSARLDLDPAAAARRRCRHYRVARDVQRILQRYKELSGTSSPSSAWMGSRKKTRWSSPGRVRSKVPHASPSRRRAVHQHAGKLVALSDTIRSFKGIISGEYDHLFKDAFDMVGAIEEAVEKLQKLVEKSK